MTEDSAHGRQYPDCSTYGLKRPDCAASALELALVQLRDELRSLIECYAMAETDTRPDAARTPKPGSLDPDAIRPVEKLLDAVRECHLAWGRMPIDDQPEWLERVIDGALKL